VEEIIVDRRILLKTLPLAATAAASNPALLAAPRDSSVKLTLEPSGAECFRPLQKATLHIEGRGWENGAVVVFDGAGREYLHEKASSVFTFAIGGGLGRQTARLLDSKGTLAAELDFQVDCLTELDDEGGVFRELLDAVLWTIMSWSSNNPVSVVRYEHRVYQLFTNWIFDHTLILKGMKYFWPDLKDAIDFFAITQREDGMIWENCYPATPDLNYFDWKFNYDGFIRRFGDGFWQLRRAPVESHVEQYFVEGLYSTWKATGDTGWMGDKLDNAIRALRHVTRSPYRWSQKHQLVHRGFTIDTWDYVSDDQQRFGGSVFMVYLGKSEFGVFHGDNTNLICQCRNLAEMLKVAGRASEAPEFELLANEVEVRLNALAWNGRFYTHWIAENLDYRPDVGVDMSSQVSLSNAYALNRGISGEKCASIIKTYQRIRREMPPTSPGEFYGIYPPFERDFTQNDPGLVWEYCNGGVLTMVAGELALGAFEHGAEDYGADILIRMKAIADRFHGYLPVALRGKGVEEPQRTFQQLSIRAQANASHGKDAAVAPLWSGDADMNLSDLPTGKQEFQGIPFEILDPAENPIRTCVVVSRQSPYAANLFLPAGAKASSIYLLNAADGGPGTGLLLTLHYADGSSHSEELVGRWWGFPTDSKYSKVGPRTQDTYRVAWKKSLHTSEEAGVYATGINNPFPDREIATIEFSSSGPKSRWLILAVTLSNAPVFFKPYDDLSTGIPDGWTGSVIQALFEGMAGIKDKGAAFSRTALTPRWESAHVHSAEITVRYPASRGYCSYKYSAEDHKLLLEFTGSAEGFEVEILQPLKRQIQSVKLDGRSIETKRRKIGASTYVILPSIQSGVHRIEMDLA
jgi:hypothetical protein